jgi:Uma2 family endonuclease
LRLKYATSNKIIYIDEDMIMTAIQEKLYTADEFWALIPELPDDKRYELIDGELIILPPSSNKNSAIAIRVARYLGNHVEKHGIGYVLGADGGYTLSLGNAVIPDISFVSKVNSPEFPADDYSPPDLAIEVISPSETPRMVTKKTERYLEAGTIMVWNIHPDDKVVEVWRKAEDGGMHVQSFAEDDTLSGGDLLPEFSLTVSEIFKGI